MVTNITIKNPKLTHFTNLQLARAKNAILLLKAVFQHRLENITTERQSWI